MVSLFVRQRLTGLAAVQRRADLLVLSELLAAGSLTPVIRQVYPLDDAVEVLRMLESGDPHGKLLVTP